MRTRRRILHPTDFTDASRAAFRRALALCRRRRAELVLMHVLTTSVSELDAIGWPPVHEAYHADRRRSADHALAAHVASAQRRGVRARALVVEGVPSRAITEQATSLHADMIVMGIHGGHGLWGLLFGGTAASVIAHAKCPVLTVRDPRAARPQTHAGVRAARGATNKGGRPMKMISMGSGTSVLVLATVLAAASGQASELEAHSGILTAIDPAHHLLTLSEMGPWKGPDTARTTRSIAITPSTGIELARRSKHPTAGGWPGGYSESPLTPAQLHPGDFATVKVAGHGQHATAVSIAVVRGMR